ncbi:hypothetical protein U0070_025531 [Myodes glareolus]|uniref:Uncharacterized protein n=1 Tax=Myodes glareolus TaxID=447135 RepID=A0AAW0IEJ8_MYOGA
MMSAQKRGEKSGRFRQHSEGWGCVETNNGSRKDAQPPEQQPTERSPPVRGSDLQNLVPLQEPNSPALGYSLRYHQDGDS